MAREGRVGLLAVAKTRRCSGELAVRELPPVLSSPCPLLLLGLASMRRTCSTCHAALKQLHSGASQAT